MSTESEGQVAYVVLGDVVGSRDVADRDAFQRDLVAACETATERCEGAVVAPFAVLKGVDEVGGVLTSVAPVYDAVRALADGIAPQEMRFAVARGRIDVGYETGDVARMDGPAFHRANDLIEGIESSRLLFEAAVDDSRLDTAVADEITLLLRQRAAWTERQHEVISLYREYGTQYDVAEALGISQQAVSKSLRGVDWRMVTAIEDRLRETLEALDR